MKSGPFDDLAADYDRTFTHSLIGRHMREAVWRRLDARFRPGDRVLEINCGTGEDAVHLAERGVHVLATDASAQMVCAARDKVACAGLTDLVDVWQMPIEELEGVNGQAKRGPSAAGPERGEGVTNAAVSPSPAACGPRRMSVSERRTKIACSPLHPFTPSPPQPFDGLLSNFGGLNCVADLRGVAEGAADCLRPGGIALLCLMGPLCPWEWVWYLGQGKPGKAFRRLRRGGVCWRGLTIRYPSVRAVRAAFAPRFRLARAAAVGALVPPTYAEAWAARHPRLLASLDRWERRWETRVLLPWLADHYLLEMERLP